jgi:hypothetical protein
MIKAAKEESLFHKLIALRVSGLKDKSFHRLFICKGCLVQKRQPVRLYCGVKTGISYEYTKNWPDLLESK